MIRYLLALVLLLAGCSATLPPVSRPPVEAISGFTFQGRVAVRQGEARHYLKIDWQHDPGADAILLATPLGQGVAEIVRDAGGARLMLADRRSFVADDWSALAEQVFGFRLPLREPARWLLGVATDEEGWFIHVVERENQTAAALPTVIELERDDIHIRLKIDEWIDVR